MDLGGGARPAAIPVPGDAERSEFASSLHGMCRRETRAMVRSGPSVAWWQGRQASSAGRGGNGPWP